MRILPDFYLRRLENAILQASSVSSSSSSASNGSALESSQRLDVERCQSQDGLANACLQLIRRRGWGTEVHLQQRQEVLLLQLCSSVLTFIFDLDSNAAPN